MNEVSALWEPSGWETYDFLLNIKNSFAARDWSLVWIPREANKLAHAVAAHSLVSNSDLVFDEFSVGGIPPSCLDCLFSDQFAARM